MRWNAPRVTSPLLTCVTFNEGFVEWSAQKTDGLVLKVVIEIPTRAGYLVSEEGFDLIGFQVSVIETIDGLKVDR